MHELGHRMTPHKQGVVVHAATSPSVVSVDVEMTLAHKEQDTQALHESADANVHGHGSVAPRIDTLLRAVMMNVSIATHSVIIGVALGVDTNETGIRALTVSYGCAMTLFVLSCACSFLSPRHGPVTL